MSIKGQQLSLHYEDFTTYIITLNRLPQPQECLSGTATVFTLRRFHHLYNNFKQDTATTGMSIKGQQLCLLYEDFHHPYNNFKLDTTTTGMSIKGQQLRLRYKDFTTYIITLNRTPQPQECLSRDSNCIYTTRISPIYIVTFNWTP